jgi:ABC-2 type transport system permease protein
MFQQIFWFDIKRHFKRPSTWIFFVASLLLTAFYITYLGGLIPGAKNEANAYINSARSCAFILNGLINNSLVGTIILITVMAPAIQKDFQYNFHRIYFTKPISKFGYVVGRFLSGYLTALFVLSGAVLAFILMNSLSVYPPGKMGSYNIWTSLQGFIYLILPNTFFVGALFFSIVTLTRNLIAGYVTCVVLLMLLNNGSLMPASVSSFTLAMKDPYGGDAIWQMTKDWTPEMENKFDLSFSSYLLYNRLIWLAVSGVLFLFTYSRFDFQQNASKLSWFRGRKVDDEGNLGSTVVTPTRIVTPVFDTALLIKQWLSLTKLELKNLAKSPYFIIILLLPSIIFIIDGDHGGAAGKPNLPTTFRMIDAILNFSRAYVNIIIVFYAAALVWRERSSKVEDMIWSTPVKTLILMFSKIASLIGMYLLITVYFMLFFMFFQLAKGFTDIQPLVYMKYLFGYNIFNVIIICCFVVCVQGITNNKYLGYLLCIAIMLFLPIALDRLGIKNGLMRFNSGNRFLFSEMNGEGSHIGTFMLYKMYWLGFIAVLLISADLFWSRAKENGFKNRLKFAHNSITKSHLWLYVLSLIFMVLFGIIIS